MIDSISRVCPANVFIETFAMTPRKRKNHLEKELARQHYYAERNAVAAKSHQKTRKKRLEKLGIDPDKIKSIPPKTPPC